VGLDSMRLTKQNIRISDYINAFEVFKRERIINKLEGVDYEQNRN